MVNLIFTLNYHKESINFFFVFQIAILMPTVVKIVHFKYVKNSNSFDFFYLTYFSVLYFINVIH